jgi:hypothetical protein
MFAIFILVRFYRYDRVTASLWIRYPGILLGEGYNWHRYACRLFYGLETSTVGEVYQWLKSILGTPALQQAKSSLLHRVETSILPPPANPKDEEQKATQGALEAGMTSSLESFSTCDRLVRQSARSEHQTYRRHRPGDDNTQSQPCAQNLHHGGHDDHEGRNLIPEGSCPKVFRSAICNARFPRCF